MNRFYLIALVTMMMTTVMQLQGQNFPVSGTVQMTSGQIPSLSGLSNPMRPALFYTLLNTDISKPVLQVRLSISISSQSAAVRTNRSVFTPTPIVLQYGVPVTLTGADMREYFDVDHLDFFGITREEFLSRGQLPEGIYSFCVEAYEYVRFEEQPISNNACAAGMIVDHDPPILTSLIGDHEKTEPQNYIFSWQPMHVGAFAVEYNLKIYEWIEGLTLDQVLQNIPPVFQITTGRLLYQYSISDPVLDGNKRYIVRVQVRAVNGDAYFKNEGFSEPRELRLTEECGRGMPCDDGNPCTINDRWTSNCDCVGTPLPDSDGDGVCDEQDICPGGNDLVDTDEDCIPDGCDDCYVGQPCDDGNECTTNDTYQQVGASMSCDCVGIPSPDGDGDGVCNELDVCPGHDDNVDMDEDGYPDGCDDCVLGAPCDDGNPATTGDVYVWNSNYPTGVPLPAGVNPCECFGIEVPCDLDSDGDGVCDPWDECPGHDDDLDSDGDGVPNGCDKCNGHNDHEDDDGDGIPNGCDNRIDPPTECNSVLQLALTSAEEEIELCTFCAPLDLNMGPQGSISDRYMIYTFTLQLPSGAIVTLNANTPGFQFPYCSLTCDGSPGTNQNTANVSDLIEHLNLWLRINGFVGTASMIPNGSGPCGIPGPSLMIQATNVTPVSMQFQQIVTRNFAKVEFAQRDCIVRTLRISRLNASVTDPCNEVSFLWSNGETSSSIIVLGNNYNYSVTVTCSDGCEYTLEDALCISGTPCDDHDPCTINDTYSSSCFCTGTFVGDSDGDSVCDVLDQCPGENDLADEDDDGIPDACDEVCNSVGQSCNDGNPCTSNDTIDPYCNCVGVQGDEDGDGICDAMDQCPGYPDYEDFDLDGIPDGCDEPVCGEGMDACKVFQKIAECPNIRVLTLEELIALSAWYIEMAESNPGAFVTNLDEIDDLEVETYLQQYAQETGDTMYSEINLDELYEALGIADPLKDTDGDGVVNLFDLCPEDAAAAAYTPGQSLPECVNCATIYRLMKYHFIRDCDDGDPCTEFDQFNCNCECVGNVIDQDEDGICDLDDPCPNGPNDVDSDGDGTPDACDPQPCVATGQSSHCEADGDPCTVGGVYTINPATGQCDCIEISLQVTSNCEGSGDCPDGIWFMNTQTNECECIPASPFPDADGDGVCDEMDICNDGDDHADADGDGIPDACDHCELPGALGAVCNDGDSCTIDDQLIILYDAAGEPYCACAGVYIDSDDDGVCDPQDKCPGFPDSEDYNGDGTPDGCDPPYFEIGCPSKLYVIEEAPVQGFVTTYDDIEIQEEDIPVPLTVTVAYMYQGTGHLIEFTNLAISGFQIVNGKVEVYYQAPQIAEYLEDLTRMGVTYVYTLHFSEAQTCAMSFRYVGNDIILTPNDEGASFGCPSPPSWNPNQIFGNYNGQLSMNFFNPLDLPFDLNAAPESVTLVATDAQGQSQTYSGSFTLMLPLGANFINFVTDIPFFNTANYQIVLTLSTGTVCEYGLNNLIVLNCTVTDPVTGATNSYYLGQPCDDGDQYTDHDTYQTDPATGECRCKGVISHDEDGDGVHDELDQCPGHDDNEDVNPANGVPDGCECADPVISEAEVVNGSDVKITLEPNENYASYNISYFNNANPGEVFTATATENPMMLNNLPHDATYTITVSAVCGTSFPSGGATTEVDIPFDEEAFYCGPKQDLDPGAQTLLGTLVPGDTILAGDFEVVITEVSGGINGVFSGTGYITVPFLNNVLINVSFSSATINEDYVLIGGFMQVTGAGSDILLDIFGEDFADLLDDITGFLEEVDDVLATLEQILETFENIVNGLNSCEEFYAEVAGPGGGLTELLNTLQYLPQEEVAELEAALECCSDPNAVWANCQQQITAALDSIQEDLEELYNADYQIVFEPGTTAKYGFDAYQYPALASNYATLAIGGQEYWVPWKASASAEKEPLLASKKGGGAFPADVTFEFNPDDTETHVPDQNDKVKIEPLAEAQNGKVKTLLAVQRKIIPNEPEPEVHIAGKVQVVSYDQEIINVVLVPVADASGNSAFASGFDWSTALKNIFKQAVVDVNVTVAPLLTVSGFDGVINAIPANFEESFTDEMLQIKYAYLQNFSAPTDKTIVIFVAPDNSDDNALGYMPFKQSYGFVYLDNINNSAPQFNPPISGTDLLSKAIAHEIGHGAFELKHTFEEYPALEQKSSNNLMDYASGTHLMKYQWDAVHSRDWDEAGTFDPEEGSSEYTNVTDMSQFENLDNEDGTYTFLTPAGTVITIPANTTKVSFVSGDEINISDNPGCFPGFKAMAFGTLAAFAFPDPADTSNILEYVYCVQCGNADGGFLGYSIWDGTSDCNDIYIDSLSTKANNGYTHAILGFPYYDINEGTKFYIGKKTFGALGVSPPPAGITNYRGIGQFKKFDAYKSFQFNLDESKNASVNIFPQLSSDAIKFLTLSEQYAGRLAETAMYSFLHAHQITQYPDFFQECTDIENSFPKTFQELKSKMLSRYAWFWGLYSEPGQNFILQKAEIAFWEQQNEQASIYKKYYQSKSNDLAPGYWDWLENGQESDDYRSWDLFVTLQKWTGQSCFFKNLTVDQRRIALSLLATRQLTEDNWYDHWLGILHFEEENLYNAILSTTPREDFAAILDLFKGQNNDYQLYVNVHGKMLDRALISPSSGFDEHGYAGFISSLAMMAIDQYSQSTPVGDVYIADPLVHSYDIQNLPDGKIKIILNLPSGNTSVVAEGYPFDFVNVEFEDTSMFSLDGKKIPAGSVLKLPMCYAEWLVRRYRQEKFDMQTQIVMDVFAIVVGIATAPAGGFGFFVFATDAVISTADIYMSMDKYDLTVSGNSTFNKAAHDHWEMVNLFNTALGGLDMIKSLGDKVNVKAGKSIEYREAMINSNNSSPQNIRNVTNSIISTHRTLLEEVQKAKTAFEIANSANNPKIVEFNKLIKHLRAEIDALTVANSLSKNNGIPTFLLRFDDLTTQGGGDKLRGNIGITLITGSAFDGGVFTLGNSSSGLPRIEFEVDRIITNSNGYNPEGLINGLPVRVGNGPEMILENVEIYFDASIKKFFFKLGQQISGSAANFPAFYNFFSNKGWVGSYAQFNAIFDQQINSSSIASRFANLNQEQTVQMIGAMSDWTSLSDFTDFRAAVLADNGPFLGTVLSDIPNGVSGWKILKDANVPESGSPHYIARIIDDLDRFNNYSGFLKNANNAPQRALLWKRLNQNGLSADELILSDWLEELWFDASVTFNNATNASEIYYDSKKVAHIIDNPSAPHIEIEGNGIDRPASAPEGDEVVSTSKDPGKSYALGCKGGKCGIFFGACFPAGTPVHTPAGVVPIEKIQPGDSVVAYDEITQDTVISRVFRVVKRGVRRLQQLVVGQDTIRSSTDHPYYVPALNRYVPADSVRKGMQVLALAGTLLTVQQSVALDTIVDVYNFEVLTQHNYFVGNDGVLVHNTNLANNCIANRAQLHTTVRTYIEQNFTNAQITKLLDEIDDYEDVLQFFAGAANDPVKQLERIKAWQGLSNTSLSHNITWLNRAEDLVHRGFQLSPNGGEVRILTAAGTYVARINGGVLKHNYTAFGGEIVGHSSKTTTVVGRFLDPQGGGTQYFLATGPIQHLHKGDYVTATTTGSQLYKYGENPGGFNLLNIQPPTDWTWTKNEDWLTEAMNRGDEIRIISDPNHSPNIWRNGVDYSGYPNTKTISGREIDHLHKNGWAFDAASSKYKKIFNQAAINRIKGWMDEVPPNAEKLDAFYKDLYENPGFKTTILNSSGEFGQEFEIEAWEVLWDSGKKTISSVNPNNIDEFLSTVWNLKNTNLANTKSLLTALPINKVDEVVRTIRNLHVHPDVTSLSSNMQDIFINRLMSNSSFNTLKDNLALIDEELIRVWGIAFDEGRTKKCMDYAFISPFKGQSADDIAVEISKHEPSSGIINELNSVGFTDLIPIVNGRRAVRDNYIAHLNGAEGGVIESAFSAGGYPARNAGEAWENYFERIKDTRNAIQIHHVLAVQQMKLSEGMRNYLRHYNGPGKLDYHASGTPQNAIPLEHFSGGSGVHSNHHDYDDAIAAWIDNKWSVRLAQAANDEVAAAGALHNDIMDLVDSVKAALVQNSIIGTNNVNMLFGGNLGSNQAMIDAVQSVVDNF